MLAEGIRNDAGYGACIVPLWFQKRLRRRFSRTVWRPCLDGMAAAAYPGGTRYAKKTSRSVLFIEGMADRAAPEALRRDHGMCVRCMERFMNGGEKPRLAVIVHHKNPERNTRSLSWNLTTWKACVTSAIIASILKRERKSPKQVYRISAKAYESSTFERVRA